MRMNFKTLSKRLRFAVRKKTAKYIVSPFKRMGYRFRYKHLADPEKIITIRVGDIGYWYTGNRYDEITFPGEIRGGDWSDMLVSRADRLSGRPGWVGIREHFEEGMPWEETALFREKYVPLFEKQGVIKGCRSLSELAGHYSETVDVLFENVKREGILPQSQERPEIDPIYIHIGPDGEIIYTVDGNHRLYMAMILGIEEIPVKVWMRHKKWQEIREKILRDDSSVKYERLKRFLNHPDLISEAKMDVKI
jgi:hypothetical protein